MEQYYTIKSRTEGLFKDKGSKFIAYAFQINSEDKILEIYKNLKAEHPKSRHVCWAYRLGEAQEEMRSNDDGEPSGSAGKPILNTIQSKNLHFIAVFVVRYFGGTLLGVPGLIQAYKEATKDALKDEYIYLKEPKERRIIEFDFLQLNAIMQIIKKNPIHIVNQEIDNLCKIEIEYKISDKNLVNEQLNLVI